MTPRWVGDDCRQKPPANMPEKRAQGILAIHEKCDPPCPRKVGALKRLGMWEGPEPESSPARGGRPTPPVRIRQS
ncbi:hypothetical protein [Nocardia asiatica]|uniref:hypothetical protein n=1 Tax=Nocardia asiatica TaxID=209252 RepID=UPI0002FC9A08|nr:hypothetical protein [Nocardia asiatica]